MLFITSLAFLTLVIMHVVIFHFYYYHYSLVPFVSVIVYILLSIRAFLLAISALGVSGRHTFFLLVFCIHIPAYLRPLFSSQCDSYVHHCPLEFTYTLLVTVLLGMLPLYARPSLILFNTETSVYFSPLNLTKRNSSI